jgi:antagonist of KipI
MSILRVIQPGMLTTIQDRGRWGLQALGVPVAGPMDPFAHRAANAIVGNGASAATFEVTLIGPELEFEDERVVAVTGAVFHMTIDGRPAPHATAFVVSAGERLRFGSRVRGARAYIGISGGVAVEPVLRSRATHLISRTGGLGGRQLKAGDHVPLGVRASFRGVSSRPFERPTPLPEGHATIRVLAGPQTEYFADDALDALQSAPYVVGGKSDRMGYRLEGPVLRHARGADIISDATPLGVLQVPASGQPILLMADRQTTGGYPKLATVITADIGTAGQLAPGDTMAFLTCTRREAMAALIAQEQRLMAIEARVAS